MRLRHQRGNDAHLDVTGLAGLDGCQKLDAVTEFRGEPDISRCDFFDAADQHILRTHPEPIRKRGQDDRLVRRVPAVHIQRGVSFGITEFLRLRERRSEVQAVLRHAREDVVARPVQDPVDRLETVSHKRLAHRFDDRDAAGHRGLVKHRHPLALGQFENFRPVFGQQRLVPRHDHLPRRDRLPHEIECQVDAAHQFHHHIDVGIRQHRRGVRAENTRRRLHIALLRQVAHGNPPHLESHTGPLLQQRPVFQKVRINAGTHGPEPRQSNADRVFHQKRTANKTRTAPACKAGTRAAPAESGARSP